ncbi:aromatic amino acid DMT transporter YddG [Vibrio casei]|uniref:Drug/metabolite DMT transporter permease n=1 Tax=Vibrio casei TaxID=673372 RepID=A0A368LNJ8_9VIBR|nr:aromatic amino acid DMT transporter YddG [Vibrio casei]RCS73480.1 drug/metabolite DMT transporter permease [Vibrio casei]SJN22273.1 Permease of the drug/metabolite transporter (DMT) superfamily [Vibrio casei]
MPFFKQNKYTLFGIIAILLWSSVVALIRDISELFSPIGGAAMIYTISAIFLILVMGIPKIKDFPARYLIIGTILFVAYEICFALSLGMANNRYQAMEMAIINYLWPALTILFTAILGKRKVNPLIYPSVLITFIGVAWCISGENGISIRILMDNITKNPIAYLMAFSGAFIWAAYCFITKQLSNGKNGMTLFFTATAITLWIKFFFSHEINPTFTLSSTITLLLAGIIMGAGYALWNQAIIGGNIMLLGTLSYFTPVFSTLFSSIYLSIALTGTFWQGVALVTLGSLVCYFVTREKTQPINIKVGS